MRKTSGTRAPRHPNSFASPSDRQVFEPLRLREIPLATAALSFAAGILHNHFVAQPTIKLVIALALLSLISLLALRFADRMAWLPTLAVWFTLGSCAAAWQPAPPEPLQLHAFADGLSRTVQGTITRIRMLPPQPEIAVTADAIPPWEQTETATAGTPHLIIDLAVDHAEEVTPDTSRMIPITGGIRVTIYADRLHSGNVTEATQALDKITFTCGDRLELPLRLRLPERYNNPGQYQYADYLLTQGISARSNVAADHIQLLGTTPPTMACRLAAAQAWAASRFTAFAISPANQHLPVALRLTTADTQMLAAMLFGDRSGLTHPLRSAFERTGSFHLFVVSGLHIALLAAAIFWLCRRLRLPPWLATVITLTAAAGYAALTGFGASTQRALLMTAVYLIARLLFRRGHSLNALGAAVLVLLIGSPSSLFDPGFQMTVLALIAIAGLAVPLSRYLFLDAARVAATVFRQPRRERTLTDSTLRFRLELWGEVLAIFTGIRRTRKLPAYLVRVTCWAAELALIGLVTELVMVLPMAVWFNRAAVFALPANMLVIPLLTILIPSAVATFVASLISPWLAAMPAALTAGLLHMVTAAVGRLSHLQSADVRIPAPFWPISLAAVGLWLVGCWLVRRGRWGALTTACALPLIAAAILWPEPEITAWRASDLAANRPLELTAIDIGQGDSLLAVAPDGRTMLIDAGGPIGRNGQAEVTAGFDTGEQVVAPYLWSRRIRRLDVVVLSHAHTDHMGGMPAILEDLRPRELWVSVDADSAMYRGLLAQAVSLGIVVRHLRRYDLIAWGPVAVSVLSPADDYVNAGAPKNDDSLVLHMQYGAASILLEGDAEHPSEDAMLAAGLISPVTLLKAGHHGSKTSSTPEFLAAAKPQMAVISSGRHNPFGHPKSEVVERFAEAHTRLYRTDLFGLTSFFLTRDGRIREQVGDGPLLQSSWPW